MVVFNTIKKGDEIILIYNYIPYNIIFLNLLYIYVSLEQKICLFTHDVGYIASDYLFIIDKNIKDVNPYLSNLDNHMRK